MSILYNLHGNIDIISVTQTSAGHKSLQFHAIRFTKLNSDSFSPNSYLWLTKHLGTTDLFYLNYVLFLIYSWFWLCLNSYLRNTNSFSLTYLILLLRETSRSTTRSVSPELSIGFFSHLALNMCISSDAWLALRTYTTLNETRKRHDTLGA